VPVVVWLPLDAVRAAAAGGEELAGGAAQVVERHLRPGGYHLFEVEKWYAW
jgi:hypothetical protein